MTAKQALKIWDKSVGFNEVYCEDSKVQEAISTAFKYLRESFAKKDEIQQINRTPQNCSLIAKKGDTETNYPHRTKERCQGYSKSNEDDEPCEECKECKYNEFYEE